MEGKILVMHPEFIVYALILAGIVLLAWRKKNKFKKGIIIANTKYVKGTKYFKMLNAKYRIYNIIIKIICIILIFLGAVLSSRLYEVKKHNDEYNNRDIMLCMDFSPSMSILNSDILKTMYKTVDNLKDERFGITIWDSGINNLVPLTTDYNYVKFNLDNIRKNFFGESESLLSTKDYNNYIKAGRTMGIIDTKGYQEKTAEGTIKIYNTSSRISDGLAACARNFKNDDRTKVIIFSTDNLGEGMFISMEEATNYCIENNIKVYPIGAVTIKDGVAITGKEDPREGLIKLAQKTNGKYFDYTKYSVSAIANEIENLTESAQIKSTYVTREELPDKLFPYIMGLIIILFLLEWRVRI